MRFGNLIDLRGLQFKDAGNGNFSKWIQAMPLGKYMHPMHGVIDITPERVARFADNVNKGVRGQALDIDYDHKQHNGKAAGWVQKAEARPDGLWILVEWVKEAWDDIKSGAYRYFSPEFVDEWVHPASQSKFNDVLFGGGITNRPFLKGILPINLSEIIAESETNESNLMFTEEQRAALLAKLGLAEDADDQTILMALITAATGGGEQPPVEQAGENQSGEGAPDGTENNDGTAGQPDPGQGQAPTSVTVKFSEDIVKLAESNPAIKALMDTVEANNKQLREIQNTSTVDAIVKKFAEKGLALPATALNALTQTIQLSEDDRVTGAVIQMLGKIAEAGLIELGESDVSTPNLHRAGGKVDYTKQLSEAASKLAKEQGISFGDAMIQVAMENPEAYESHRSDSYIA